MRPAKAWRRHSRPSASIWSRASLRPFSGHDDPPPPALPRISPSGPVAPRLQKSPRISRRACRSTPWRDPAASSSICRRRMSRPSFSTRGRSPIWPATPISCACRMRSAPGCARSSISSSNGSRLKETSRNCSSTIRPRVILARKSPPGATPASSGAATPKSRCSPPSPCAMAESRSGSATASRFQQSTAPLSTSWTTPPSGRLPRNSTTTCSSSTRWPARRRMRFMSSAKPRRIQGRFGASSTHPRSNGRWTIPQAGSGTRSAR